MKRLDKTWFLLPLSFCLVLLLSFCTGENSWAYGQADDTDTADAHILVAYFSRANYVPDGTDAVSGATNKSGNTQTVAQYICQKTGGTLFEIVPGYNYPVSHSQCSAIARREAENNERPALVSHVEDMSLYDIVFVGFPIWVYREPMAVLTFLEEYDFAGKVVIPFCTSMAVGIDASEEDFRKTLPDATIPDGLRISYNLPADWQHDVDNWLRGMNLDVTTAHTPAATDNLSIRNHGGNLVISGSDLHAALLYDIRGNLIARTRDSSPLLLTTCDRTGIFLLKLLDQNGNTSCTTIRL